MRPAVAAGRAFVHRADEHASVALQDDVSDEIPEREEQDAAVRAFDAAFGAQLLDDALDRVRRDGETDAGALGDAQGRDADNLPLGVHQRAAGVAGVDRGIRLDPQVVRGEIEIPAGAGDDAEGDRSREAERTAQRHHELAGLDRVGIAKLGHGQGSVTGRQLDLNQRQIGVLIQPGHARRELLAC